MANVFYFSLPLDILTPPPPTHQSPSSLSRSSDRICLVSTVEFGDRRGKRRVRIEWGTNPPPYSPPVPANGERREGWKRKREKGGGGGERGGGKSSPPSLTGSGSCHVLPSWRHHCGQQQNNKRNSFHLTDTPLSSPLLPLSPFPPPLLFLLSRPPSSPSARTISPLPVRCRNTFRTAEKKIGGIKESLFS